MFSGNALICRTNTESKSMVCLIPDPRGDCYATFAFTDAPCYACKQTNTLISALATVLTGDAQQRLLLFCAQHKQEFP